MSAQTLSCQESAPHGPSLTPRPFGGWSRGLGARLLRFTVGLVLVAAFVFVTAGPGSAEDGLMIESESRFVADTIAAELRVSITFELFNDLAPVVEDDQTTDSFFAEFRFLALSGFDEMFVTTANAQGAPLPLNWVTETIDDSPSVELIIVELASRLAYGESQSVTVNYVVPNGAARSDDPVRVSESYLAFPVIACCDPDNAAVQVEVPQRFSVDIEGTDADFDVASERGFTVLTQSDIADPEAFNAFVFGRNDDELVISSVAIGDITVQVEAWADDEVWADFVADSLVEYIPQLEQAIGQPWPQGDALRIVETTTPYRFGYAGWYRHRDDVIEVGEVLDEQVLVHELTHAWFSDELFDSRWINEGLAEYYSSLVLAPTAGDRPPRGSLFALPLSQWTRPIGVPTSIQDQQELFGYSASFSVVSAIVDEIGTDGLARVLEASRRGEISFVAGEPIEADPNAWKSWQRFLDLVEERGGWDDAQSLFREWVTTPEEAALLDIREATHREYDTYVDDTAGWAPPVGLRSALTVWEFNDAMSLMDLGRTVHDERAALATQTEELDLPFPGGLQESYEASVTAQDLEATSELIEAKLAGVAEIRAVTELLAAEPTRMQELGLQGRDLTVELATMREAWIAGDEDAMSQTADGIREGLTEAGSRGWRTALLVALIAAGLLAIVALLLFNRRQARPEPTVELDVRDTKANDGLVCAADSAE